MIYPVYFFDNKTATNLTFVDGAAGRAADGLRIIGVIRFRIIWGGWIEIAYSAVIVRDRSNLIFAFAKKFVEP